MRVDVFPIVLLKSNYCCLITVIGLEFSMIIFSGRYILKTEVLLLYVPNIVTVFHLPNSCESSPLVMMAEDIFPSEMIAVTLGL